MFGLHGYDFPFFGFILSGLSPMLVCMAMGLHFRVYFSDVCLHGYIHVHEWLSIFSFILSGLSLMFGLHGYDFPFFGFILSGLSLMLVRMAMGLLMLAWLLVRDSTFGFPFYRLDV